MIRRLAGVIHHRMPHEEPMQEESGGREGRLRDLQHDAYLREEVDAFRSIVAFLLHGHAIENRGRLGKVIEGEKPLVAYSLQLGIERRSWHIDVLKSIDPTFTKTMSGDLFQTVVEDDHDDDNNNNGQLRK